MPITVCCRNPGCKEVFDVRDAMAGRTMKCPACGIAVQIATHRQSAMDDPEAPIVQPIQVGTFRPQEPAPPRRGRRRSRLLRRRPRAGRRPSRGPKVRHGCLTTWLVLVMLVNSALAVLSLLALSAIGVRPGREVSLLLVLVSILFLAQALFALAIFNWKRWGFWGLCVTNAIGLIANLKNGDVVHGVLGLGGLAILWWVLQMGDRDKGWDQLD